MAIKLKIAILAAATVLVIAATADASPLAFNRAPSDVRSHRVSPVLLNPQPLPPGPCKNCPGSTKVKRPRYQIR